ncbi:MAG: hypothetical protein KDB14_24265 [Planctomycetales bacterium]|nr:hypothetical protein [Planctomycetales bacterium]
MKTLDFARSFLTFRIDALKRPPVTASHKPPYSLNNARIQLECRCRLRRADLECWYFLGASCKTERVGVAQDIWTEPNADFVPIFSAEQSLGTHNGRLRWRPNQFLHVKTYARCGVDVELYGQGGTRQTDRQSGQVVDAFDDLKLTLVEAESRELATVEEVVQATLSGVPLVARTAYQAGGIEVLLEYPVKTINANERDMIYQTDTGPVLFPDQAVEDVSQIAGFELAYAAFNCAEWTEFLLRAPTEVSPDVQVQHYSRPLRVNCRNQLFAVDDNGGRS